MGFHCNWIRLLAQLCYISTWWDVAFNRIWKVRKWSQISHDSSIFAANSAVVVHVCSLDSPQETKRTLNLKWQKFSLGKIIFKPSGNRWWEQNYISSQEDTRCSLLVCAHFSVLYCRILTTASWAQITLTPIMMTMKCTCFCRPTEWT